MRNLSAPIAALLLCGILSVQALAQGIPANQTQILFIENVGLPAIQSIIRSLEIQNAPVPSELTELVKSAGDTDAFYALASSYFGLGWQERLSRDAASLMDPEAAEMVRMRIYLASLASNAERIARTSPLDAGALRGMAQNLTRQSQYLKSEDDRAAFFTAFAESQEKIFPKETSPNMDNFKQEVSALLTDMSDAIDILVDGLAAASLKEKRAELAEKLASITGNQELAAWLAQFDAFAGKLLSHTTPVDTEILMEDARALLIKLHTYLAQLAKNGIVTGGFLEESASLLQDAESAQSPAKFDAFMDTLEDALTRISQRFPAS